MTRRYGHNPADSPLGRFLTHPGQALAGLAHHAVAAVRAYGPWAVPALLTGALLAWAAHQRLSRRRHTRLAEGARYITILPPPRVDRAGAETMWGHLTGLLRPAWKRLTTGQPHVCWEYTWTRAGISIGLWVPGTVPPGMAERVVQAAWPGASTTTRPAASQLPVTAEAACGALRLARPEPLPLKTGHDADPLRALLGAGAGLADGEHAIVQILARPATGGRLRKARRTARRLKAGRPASRASRLFDLLTHQPQPSGTARGDPEHAAEVRALVTKAASLQWEAAIRYAVSGAPGAADAGRWARGRAHAIASAFTLYAGRNWLARQRLRHGPRAVGARRMRGGDLLSVPELAALAHLPLDDAVPGLERAGATAVMPPPGVPAGGPAAKPLGDSDAGIRREVAIAVSDARHHLHIIGATGSGKSTLMINMVLADVTAGRGVIVVDPKGDLVTDLLARLPSEAAGRLVLLDPDGDGPPPCLNVLDGPAPELTVDHLAGIFHKIYADFWGPRTDDVFRSACLTLLRAGPLIGQQPTLAHLPELLADPHTRDAYASAVHDPVLGGFWSWYGDLSDAARAQVIGPLMNKLRAFLLRGFVRAAIAGGPSTMNMDQVLDGGLCLVRLPKGRLGDETTRLLGSFVVAKAWQAATHRTRLAETARRDAAMYLDECQNFLLLPHSLPDMLAEARAYRLSLVLAHQHLAQLPKDLREGISANARSKIFFSTSPEDARDLERHTAPTLSAHDLSHLGLYQAAARLVTGGQETPAFTLRTRPLPPPAHGRSRLLRAAAHRNTPRHTSKASQPFTDPRHRPGPSATHRPSPPGGPR